MEAGFDDGVLEDLLAVGVDIGEEAVRIVVGILGFEKLVGDTDLDGDGRTLLGRIGDPLDVGLGLLEGDIVLVAADHLEHLPTKAFAACDVADRVRHPEETNGLSWRESEVVL